MIFENMNRRALLLASVASVSMIGGAALAQDEEDGEDGQVEQLDAPAQEEAEAAGDRDTVVVTGSRLRRDEFSSASPVQVINAEQATLEGLVDTGDILQQSSVAAGSVQLNNQFGGFVVQGGTGVNSISLRGLGAQRSLVLLNGRRPGPAGVRGQVGSFDLNVIPDSVVQRFEILKDGASSVYGSDAVAGVVNIITLTSLDRPQITVQTNQPLAGGGEQYSIDGAFGLNWANGSAVIAGQVDLQNDLSIGDRDYLSCPQDIVFDSEGGQRIDRVDNSVLAGTQFGGCGSSTVYHNTVIDLFTGARYVPSPDGRVIGPIPGYRPRENGRYDDGDGIPAFYEDVLHNVKAQADDAINETKRYSLYANSTMSFDVMGGVDWYNEVLFTRRETRSEGTRQFFPLIADSSYWDGIFPPYVYANDPDYSAPFLLSLPVMYYPSNSEVTVDYFSASTEFNGQFGGAGYFSDWGWTALATYSHSDGEYVNENQIFADQSGDVSFDDDAPVFDYFSPAILSGNYPDNFYSTLGGDIVGNTTYEQFVVSAFVNGDLFSLPAGDVLIAIGAEYRDFSINDVPDEQAQAGNLWGFTSAQITEGSDSVIEGFGEIEIPLLAGITGFEELTLNASGRIFDYDSTGSDEVWKVGVNWQIVPMFRLRGTIGTSYRSPALFELFLGNQTSFLSQLNIDPCINWQDSTNTNIRNNCAAEGIPPDYAGGGSSATIISGGGAGVLVPETSDARTVGAIFTPDFIPLSVAVDYFEIEVQDQIAQLGAGSIVAGCYSGDNFPNAFCDLFTRGTPFSEFAISEVNDSFININEQISRGIDLTARYEQDYDFGSLLAEVQATWTLEDVVELFDPNQVTGFDTNDFNRTIGDPDVVLNGRLQLERGDWTFSWFTNFIGHTSDSAFVDSTFSYFGNADSFRIIDTEAIWYHDASVRWISDLVTVTVGMTNIFDEEPPTVSTGCCTRRGNVPLVGTQYDLYGRTAFVRLTKEF